VLYGEMILLSKENLQGEISLEISFDFTEDQGVFWGDENVGKESARCFGVVFKKLL
jgi:hypothetical protein